MLAPPERVLEVVRETETRMSATIGSVSPRLDLKRLDEEFGDHESPLWYDYYEQPLINVTVGLVFGYMLAKMTLILDTPNAELKAAVVGSLIFVAIVLGLRAIMFFEVAVTDEGLYLWQGSERANGPQFVFIPHEEVQAASETTTYSKAIRSQHKVRGVRVVTTTGQDIFFQVRSDMEQFLNAVADHTSGDVVYSQQSGDGDAATATDPGPNQRRRETGGSRSATHSAEPAGNGRRSGDARSQTTADRGGDARDDRLADLVRIHLRELFENGRAAERVLAPDYSVTVGGEPRSLDEQRAAVGAYRDNVPEPELRIEECFADDEGRVAVRYALAGERESTSRIWDDGERQFHSGTAVFHVEDGVIVEGHHETTAPGLAG